METIVLALDFDKVCRVCLLESESMFSIYSQLFEQNSEEQMPTIYEILITISNIKILEGDAFPRMICTKCIDSAHTSYKFQQQCNKSQSILESYLEQIKELNEENNSLLNTDGENQNKVNVDEITAKINSNSTDGSDLPLEDDLIAEGLEFINNDYLKNNGIKEIEDNDDCDDLNNCIPLGEDTVDQLIKENFRVENLELISPKMNFNLNVKVKDEDNNVPATPYKNSNSTDIPSMNYYKTGKNDNIMYDCNICNRSFKFPNQLRTHLKSHDDERPYLCNECKKGFKAYRSLMYHVRSHSKKQPFECKECGKQYKQSGTLTAHMRIHTGSKPYLCSICGRGFRQAPDLTYHMRTHTKERPYMCNICGKTMSMQCHLVQHMRSHTGEKPFKCLVCEKAFPSSTRLKRHSIVHTTLKPYKCTVCDKSFNRSSSLKVHSKIHSGVKSHKCYTCNKVFLWAHSLRAHLLTHSKTTKNDVVDNSLVKFTTMTIYSDEQKPGNESFAIFSREDLDCANDSFQICTLAAEEQSDELETFMLYSAESDLVQSSDSKNPMKLSLVGL